MSSTVQLIGVYQLPVTEELIATQAELLYGGEPSPDNVVQVRQQLESTVLVEVLVSNADDAFDVSVFTQENPELPYESWQVAWAEAFLSADGQELLVERGNYWSNVERNFRPSTAHFE
jgi:hypothetical protein